MSTYNRGTSDFNANLVTPPAQYSPANGVPSKPQYQQYSGVPSPAYGQQVPQTSFAMAPSGYQGGAPPMSSSAVYNNASFVPSQSHLNQSGYPNQQQSYQMASSGTPPVGQTAPTVPLLIPCPLGSHCGAAVDPAHTQIFRHPCPGGHNCPQIAVPHHAALMVHDCPQGPSCGLSGDKEHILLYVHGCRKGDQCTNVMDHHRRYYFHPSQSPSISQQSTPGGYGMPPSAGSYHSPPQQQVKVPKSKPGKKSGQNQGPMQGGHGYGGQGQGGSPHPPKQPQPSTTSHAQAVQHPGSANINHSQQNLASAPLPPSTVAPSISAAPSPPQRSLVKVQHFSIFKEEEVLNWLRNLSSMPPEMIEVLVKAFKKHHISGPVLVTLSEKDLEHDMGIDQLGPRRQFMAELNRALQ